MTYNRLHKVEAGLEPVSKTATALGEQLKGYFDALTCGPVPDRLLKLTEALEQAFDRGDLRCCEARATPLAPVGTRAGGLSRVGRPQR